MKKLQEENDQLKDTLEKMKKISASNLNERERDKVEKGEASVNVWPAASIQRRSGTQHAADDVKGHVSRGHHKDRPGRGESDTCKLALEKFSASIYQSRKETRCLRSQLTALGNKYQDVEQRMTKATEQAANIQLVSGDHDELTERQRLFEYESVERIDQLNDSDTVLPVG